MENVHSPRPRLTDPGDGPMLCLKLCRRIERDPLAATLSFGDPAHQRVADCLLSTALRTRRVRAAAKIEGDANV